MIMKQIKHTSVAAPALSLLCSRLEHWSHWRELGPFVINNLRDVLPAILPKLPTVVGVTLIKTICNAWNTSRRLSADVKQCLLGCGRDEGDQLRHYFHCPMLWHIIIEEFPAVHASSDLVYRCPSLLGLAAPMGATEMARHLLFLDALRSVYEALREQSKVATLGDLAGRIRSRLKVSAQFSAWVRRRCAEICVRPAA